MTVNTFGSPGPYLNGANYAHEHANGYEQTRDLPDDNMERIRDLILGDLRRSWDARLLTLETRLQTLEGKLDALRHETHAARDEHMTSLAEGIHQLGQHVRSLNR